MKFRENLLTASPVDDFFELQASFGGGLEFGRGLVYAIVGSTTNLGRDLPQAPEEVGPELGAVFRFGDLRGTLFAAEGEGLFSGPDKRSWKFGTRLGWNLRSDLSVLQTNEWITLRDLHGSRSNLVARWIF